MDIFEYIDRVKANFDKQPEPRYNMKKYFMGGSVTTPKRGLVDGPGSYSQDKTTYDKTYYEKNKEIILKKQKEKRLTPKKLKEKIKKTENVAAWKKANPNLDFDSLSSSIKTRIRQGELLAGTFQQKPPGIYTIQELAKVEGMPFAELTLQQNTHGNNKQSKKLLEALKNAGIEQLPITKIGQQKRFKMLNSKESMEKLIDYAMTLDRPPKKLTNPYYKQIPIEYKKLVKSGKPFSIENLRTEVLKSLPENVYKLAEGSFNAMVKQTLTEKQRNKFTRGTILTKTKNLQPRKIIIDNILDGKTNIKQLAKASNLSKKEVGEQIQSIFRTIYRSKEDIGAKRKVKDVILKDYSLKDFEKIVTNINKEPTLDSFFRQGYRDFLFSAIGNPNNPDTYQPKKYARALERLIAYNSVNRKLEKEFGIKLTLDHSLSKGAIKTIKDAEPSQFLRVNPIPQKINLGIKKTFDIKYQKVIKALKSGEFRGEELKNLLIQKVELERLAKDIGLPFGKMSPTGKIIKYDAVDFLNKNLPSEIKAGVSLPNKIRQAVDKMDPTVLKERFKIAFGDRADDVLKVLDKVKNQDNLQDIYKFLKPLLRVKGFRVDASDFLNTISDAIVPQAAAAEVLPGEAQAATPKPMDFDLDMSSPTPSESLKYLPDYGDAALAGTGASIASKYMKKGDPLKKFRRFITAAPVRRGLGHLLRPFGTVAGAISAWPLAAYAVNKFAEPGEPPVKAFDYKNPIDRIGAAAELGLSKQLVGGSQQLARKFKNPLVRRTIQRFGNLGLSPKLAIRAARVGSPIGWATLGLEGAYQYGKWANKEIERIKNMTPEEKEQYIAEEQEQMGVAAANGGLINLTRTTPPEKGPQSQGLAYFMKNGKR